MLSSSVSAVNSLENEAVKLRGVVSRQEEEMHHASMVHEDLQQKWTQLTEVNTSLRAHIVSMSVSQSLGQNDSSMRSLDEEGLRVELAASLARESSLGNELSVTRLEVQRFVSETNAQRLVSEMR